MALRDQPYIPLYVQDYLTDEKLNECCPASQGIYIKIMCLMHKSKEYGMILLKQKYKQSSSIYLNFACQISNHLTFTKSDIEKALRELIEEDVLQLEEDKILQKRMIKDNDISLKRSNAGKKGGGNPNFVSDFVKTKVQTNTENESEDEIEIENKYKNKREIFIEKYPDSLKIVEHFIETLEPDNRYIPRTDAQNLEWLKVAQWSINQMGEDGVAKVTDIIDYFRGGHADNNKFSWSDNWLSLKKLQNKNNDGVTYLDYFWEKSKTKFEYKGK